MAISGEKGNATLTIASGGTVSDAAEMQSATLLGFVAPAAWTAADVTYQGSQDGTTFYDLYADPTGEITTPITAGKMVSVYPADFACCQWLRIRSGTSGTPVTQGAARTFTLILGEE